MDPSPSPTPLPEAASAALADFSEFMGYVGGPQGLAVLVACIALTCGTAFGLYLTGAVR